MSIRDSYSHGNSERQRRLVQLLSVAVAAGPAYQTNRSYIGTAGAPSLFFIIYFPGTGCFYLRCLAPVVATPPPTSPSSPPFPSTAPHRSLLRPPVAHLV